MYLDASGAKWDVEGRHDVRAAKPSACALLVAVFEFARTPEVGAS